MSVMRLECVSPLSCCTELQNGSLPPSVVRRVLILIAMASNLVVILRPSVVGCVLMCFVEVFCQRKELEDIIPVGLNLKYVE